MLCSAGTEDAVLTEGVRKEIRSRLDAAFRERLRGVLLYGSEARNEARTGSDVDLMVLLDGPVRLGRDLDTIVEALYPVQLEIDAPIHATPVSAEIFEAGEWGLYRSARRDGVYL
jgi:predicted nucleotidyltransferase